MIKVYEFSQNNSGGSFHVNKNVCHRVFIEAESSDVANRKAENLGIYFDGCASGMDCSCCGDRWYEADEYSSTEKECRQELEAETQERANKYGWTVPDARIFYADGTVKEIFKMEG